MEQLSYEERKDIVTRHFGGFPMRIAFYLYRDSKGKYGIEFYKTVRKIKTENYKLSSLQKHSLSGNVSTPLEVRDIESFDELDKRLNELSKIWIGEGN